MKEGKQSSEKKPVSKRDQEAERELGGYTGLFQAAYLVGSGAYLQSETTDEVLQVAFDILDGEDAKREKYKDTATVEDRIDTITRHYNRAADFFNRIILQDTDDEVLERARDQMKTFEVALDPLSGVFMITAEQEVREGGVFDLSTLPRLQGPNTPLPETNPLDFGPITDNDYKELFRKDK